jgi:hypothetical protein
LVRAHLSYNGFGQGELGFGEVVHLLKVEPELRAVIEEAGQAQSRVGGDGALAANNLADPRFAAPLRGSFLLWLAYPAFRPLRRTPCWAIILRSLRDVYLCDVAAMNGHMRMFAEEEYLSWVKTPPSFEAFSARLKPCPCYKTCLARVFPQPVKPA